MDRGLLYGFLNNIPYISDIESSFSMLLLYQYWCWYILYNLHIKILQILKSSLSHCFLKEKLYYSSSINSVKIPISDGRKFRDVFYDHATFKTGLSTRLRFLQDCHLDVCDLVTRVEMTFCNIYQRITNQNSAVTINCICQDDNRKEKSYRVDTRPNHFPSNGVATDPNDSVILVFVTHLNTNALYFRSNQLFQN